MDYLSMDAPLGRALLGKRIGDELEVQLPGGVLTARITAIDYENEGDAHLQPR
jgi:transcription elongation factor GreB